MSRVNGGGNRILLSTSTLKRTVLYSLLAVTTSHLILPDARGYVSEDTYCPSTNKWSTIADIILLVCYFTRSRPILNQGTISSLSFHLFGNGLVLKHPEEKKSYKAEPRAHHN